MEISILHIVILLHCAAVSFGSWRETGNTVIFATVVICMHSVSKTRNKYQLLYTLGF